jgi:hypothetical protein
VRELHELNFLRVGYKILGAFSRGNTLLHSRVDRIVERISDYPIWKKTLCQDITQQLKYNITPWNTGGWLYQYGVYKPNRGRSNLVFLQVCMHPASLENPSTRKGSYQVSLPFISLSLFQPSYNSILLYSIPQEVLHLHGFTSTPYIALKLLFLKRLLSSSDSSNYTVTKGTICVR